MRNEPHQSTEVFELSVQVLRQVLRFECTDLELVRTLSDVLRDVPRGATPAHSTFALRDLGPTQFDLVGPTPWAGPVDRVEIFPRIMTAINRFALDTVGDTLCIHAAGAVIDGRALALVAPSGTGKTTLLAAMAVHGATPMNDEMLCLSEDGSEVFSWAKPLSVKPSPDGLVPDFWPQAIDDGEAFRHVPLSAIGSMFADRAPVGFVALLRRSPDFSEVAWNPVSPATAMAALGTNTMNFRGAGVERSMASLAGLVACAPCGYLDIGDLQVTEERLMSEVDAVQFRSVEWELLGSHAAYAAVGLCTARIGDECVVWSADSGRMFVLDGLGAELWLAANRSESDRILDHPGFAKQLADQGLLDLDRASDLMRSRTVGPV